MSADEGREQVAVPEDERQAVNKVAHILNTLGKERTLVLAGADGEEAPVPPSLLDAFRQLTACLARDGAVTITPHSRDLTTTEAAHLLRVSRPYLVEQLLDTGEIPYTMTGSHRRIALTDVMEYKRRRDADRHERLRRIAQVSQEMGLGPE